MTRRHPRASWAEGRSDCRMATCWTSAEGQPSSLRERADYRALPSSSALVFRANSTRVRARKRTRVDVRSVRRWSFDVIDHEHRRYGTGRSFEPQPELLLDRREKRDVGRHGGPVSAPAVSATAAAAARSGAGRWVSPEPPSCIVASVLFGTSERSELQSDVEHSVNACFVDDRAIHKGAEGGGQFLDGHRRAADACRTDTA